MDYLQAFIRICSLTHHNKCDKKIIVFACVCVCGNMDNRWKVCFFFNFSQMDPHWLNVFCDFQHAEKQAKCWKKSREIFSPMIFWLVCVDLNFVVNCINRFGKNDINKSTCVNVRKTNKNKVHDRRERKKRLFKIQHTISDGIINSLNDDCCDCYWSDVPLTSHASLKMLKNCEVSEWRVEISILHISSWMLFFACFSVCLFVCFLAEKSTHFILFFFLWYLLLAWLTMTINVYSICRQIFFSCISITIIIT